MNEEVRHFSLRKLSIGLASVLVGVSIFGASQTVKADTVADQNTSAVTSNAQSNDTQENKSAVKSTFSSDNQANNAKSNLIQTQVEGKNEQKQAQTKNVQQDSVSKTQEATDSNDLQQKDAEKDIVRTSSLQESNNQSNTVTEKTVQHDTLENGQKAQSFNLPKNSQKFNRKVLATNLSETASSTTTNGGFDEATWGKLDVTKWQGSVQDGVYQLTGYTGDKIHIIVPNEADFEKAGKSTNGLQVGITRDTISSLSNQTQTIAFSKTNNQKVKAIGTDWSHAFSDASLSKFDGSNLDVSGVTNMSCMFGHMFSRNPITISDLTSLGNWDTSKVTDMSKMFFVNKISDLTPLAHWDTSKVTDMSDMFYNNKVSNLAPLTNWDVSNVTSMSGMFSGNSISNLTPLANWNTSNVTTMQAMFARNKISDLTPLTHWDTSKVVVMSSMFAGNSDLIDLRPIANWNISSITNNFNNFDFSGLSGLAGLFFADTKLDLTNINNTPLMQGFLKKHDALLGATFITNNADLVKAVVGQDLPTLTNTAKRTIVFKIPHATPEKIVQTINYKAVAPVQIDWPIPPEPTQPAGDSSAGGGVPAISAIVLASPETPASSDSNSYVPKIVKTYPVKASDWQLDTSQPNDAIIVNGQIRFASVKIPHINGYKAYIVPNKSNLALFTVSFIAVPTENKPSTPAEETPSKPSASTAPTDHTSNPVETAPSKPSASTDHPNKPASDLQQRVVTELNNNDSGWTMPETSSTYTVEVPADDAIIDLSDLVIAEPIHAQTRTQIRVNKRFKLSKKHSIKHLKHRKNATRTFKKYRL